MTADYACKTIDPNNPAGPKIDAIFPGAYTLRLYKYSSVDFENLRAAKYVLENPKRIFFGVRAYNQGGWCYTGRPADLMKARFSPSWGTWYIKERAVAPFPKDRVFAVYVNSTMHVYECRAEYADPVDPLCPVNWQDRYRGLTWKSTS